MLGATQGYRLFHRLFQIVGPSLGTLVQVASGGKSILDVDMGSKVMSQGIQALTTSLKEKDLDHVIDLLKKQTHAGIEENSEKTVPLSGIFEGHFQGRIATMFKWVGWGLKVQFEDFSDAFANLMPPGEGDQSPAVTTKPTA